MLELTIYTAQGAIVYTINKTSENFIEVLTSALERGYVAVDTVEGSRLIINPLNVAAIEIKELSDEE